MSRVVLIIPDAGPLISLARADALDLLLALNLPVWLVDQVYFETTRDTSKQDAGRIRGFVETHAGRVNLFETRVGRLAALERSQKPEIRQRGLGEASIAEFYARLDEVIDPLDPVLLLFEDSDIQRINAIVEGNVHLVSTKAFLVGLERRGLIRSADAVWNAIRSSGRTPTETNIDLSGKPGPTRW